jgi:hypothetical protein
VLEICGLYSACGIWLLALRFTLAVVCSDVGHICSHVLQESGCDIRFPLLNNLTHKQRPFAAGSWK